MRGGSIFSDWRHSPHFDRRFGTEIEERSGAPFAIFDDFWIACDERRARIWIKGRDESRVEFLITLVHRAVGETACPEKLSHPRFYAIDLAEYDSMDFLRGQ